MARRGDRHTVVWIYGQCYATFDEVGLQSLVHRREVACTTILYIIQRLCEESARTSFPAPLHYRHSKRKMSYLPYMAGVTVNRLVWALGKLFLALFLDHEVL